MHSLHSGLSSCTEVHFKSHKQLHLTVVIINSIFSLHFLILCSLYLQSVSERVSKRVFEGVFKRISEEISKTVLVGSSRRERKRDFRE